MLKLGVVFVLVAGALLNPVFGNAQSLPEFRIDDVYIPRFLPPHPFYFLKTLRDNFKLFFTFNRVEKAKFHLDLANKRVLEIAGLSQKGNFSNFDNLIKNYAQNWNSLFNLIKKMKVDEFDAPAQKARRNFAEQKEILNYLAETVSGELSQKIKTALLTQEEKFNPFFNQFQGIDQLEKFKEELL